MHAAVDEEPVDPSDELMFLCLGGGNEVGRSCHIIQYKGKTVMVRKKEDIRRRVAGAIWEKLIGTDVYACNSSTLVNIPHTTALPLSPSTMTLISAP